MLAWHIINPLFLDFIIKMNYVNDNETVCYVTVRFSSKMDIIN